jgi:hypothetical protein
VRYIEGLSDKGLLPTRAMIANFASVLVDWELSESWVLRFMRKYKDRLVSKNTIDRNRFKADNENSYRQYFNLLYLKIE